MSELVHVCMSKEGQVFCTGMGFN